MRQLNNLELPLIQGGISDTAKVCLEGGGLGIIGGGFLGAIIASPIYYSLMNRNGISSSHYMMGLFVIGIGIVTGALFGSILGTGTGLLAACQIEDIKE